IFRSDRHSSSKGGGVCIYVRDDICGFETSDSDLLGTDCEQVWVGIKLKADLPLLVGCVYRQPPQLVDKDFIIKTDHSIAKSLEAASRLVQSKSFSAVVVMGDFNMSEIEWDENGSPVLVNVSSQSAIVSDAISSSSLVQIVNGNTFMNDGQPISLLDLILVSNPNQVSEVEIGPPLYIVKQRIIDFEFKLAQESKENPKKLYSYMNRRFSTRETIAAIMERNGLFVTEKASICNTFNEFFHSVFDEPTSSSKIKHAKEIFLARSEPDPAFSVKDIVPPEKVLIKLKKLCSDKTAGIDQIATHPLK
ncbi:RNA-directed DNA polymerase from mobile element jockey-like, partial [Brachionus plicatilis]